MIALVLLLLVLTFSCRSNAWSAPLPRHPFPAEGVLLKVGETGDEKPGNPGVFHTPDVFQTAAFQPDGKRLATLSQLSIKLWDLPSGRNSLSIPLPNLGWVGLVFSPDSKYLAVARVDNSPKHLTEIRIYDAANSKLIATFTDNLGGWDHCVFSPDSKLLVTYYSEARIWDITTGRLLRTLRPPLKQAEIDGRNERFYDLRFTADGKHLISAHLNAVRKWDVVTGKQVRSFPLGPPIGQTDDEFWEYRRFFNANASRLRTLERCSPNERLPNPKGVMIVTPKESTYVTKIWDVATGKEVQRRRGTEKDYQRYGHYSPDLTSVVVVKKDDESNSILEIWDVASLKLVRSWMVKHPVRNLFFQPDGKRLAALEKVHEMLDLEFERWRYGYVEEQ